jgi:hypothetical protein
MISETLRKTLLASGVATACLTSAGVAFPVTAVAQDADDDVIEEVVVRGYRSSL